MTDTLKHLIDVSFLSDEAKEELRGVLARQGYEAALEAFDMKLAKSMELRGKLYEEKMAEISDTARTLLEEYRAEREKREKKLERELARVSTDNLEEQDRLWSDFYANQEELHGAYRKKATDQLSALVVAAAMA